MTRSAASRPFDADRDGFVLGEGAAVLVLEALEHAMARGATILAEVAGYGTTDDANHMVQPAPDGEGDARAMRLALDDAGLQPSDIGYMNAHGTSTQLNEKYETEAIKSGVRRAGLQVADKVDQVDDRASAGRGRGAGGGVLRPWRFGRQCLPPTINYETLDPDCDLDYIPNVARARVRSAIRDVRTMNNSMGFGGAQRFDDLQHVHTVSSD